jgi:hypothetical protein
MKMGDNRLKLRQFRSPELALQGNAYVAIMLMDVCVQSHGSGLLAVIK